MQTAEKAIIRDNINKLLYTYGLNRVIRFAQKRSEIHQTQSVAEHVTNILFCAYHFRDIEDPEHKMNFDEVVRLILMHDMGEIETGDIITHNKTETDFELETAALKQVRLKSPDFVANQVESVFQRFEHPTTLEERFAKAMDKFEGQLFWFDDEGIRMIKTISSSSVIENYFKILEKMLSELGFPKVVEYVVVMKEDMIKRGLLA
jgi:5'-deoxynucleotidase YfbR-like HD superfamily hydrolase